MILQARETDFDFKQGKIYFGFGLYIDLYLNKIRVLVRRTSDLTPVLEDLSKFDIVNSCSILNWDKKIQKNGLYVVIQPVELNNFDWDLYHDGDEGMNKIFEDIYKNIEIKYGSE